MCVGECKAQKQKVGEDTKNGRVGDTLMNFLITEGVWWTGPFFFCPSSFVGLRVPPESHKWEQNCPIQ